ncbi:MAG: hypothetical protein AB7V50_06060 [Vampirovibrionia bacterium]
MVNKLQYICIIILLSFVVTTVVWAAQTVVVPAGRTIEVKLEEDIDCDLDHTGEPVTAMLYKPFYDNGEYLLPQGSLLKGKIAYLKKAGPDGVNAELKLLFTSLETPSRQIIPINAVIETDDKSGILSGSKPSGFSKFSKAVVTIGKPAAISAATGAVVGAVLPKDIKKSMAIGATVGVGVGIVKEVKEGKKKDPAIKTAEQVVKYTPAGSAYKYGKMGYKGIKQYESSNNKSGGPSSGYNLQLKMGSKQEVLLLSPMKVVLK